MQHKQQTKKSKGNSILYTFLLGSLIFFFAAQSHAALKEKLVTIAKEPGVKFYKPEVAISPDGIIYVAYEAKQGASGKGEIYLCKYEDGRASCLLNLSESAANSYEADVYVPVDGSIHAAWIDQTGSAIVVKYRYYNGEYWSKIFTFDQLTDIGLVEDLRIHVDESGNVFVVFTHFPRGRCWLVSKYGDKIISEGFPYSGRTKHADIKADSQYVHMAWQQAVSDGYAIAYSRRLNEPGSTWEPWIDMGFHGGAQRPRLELDLNNIPHVLFAIKADATNRIILYKKWNGTGFDGLKEISTPGNPETFHFSAMAAVDMDNVLVTLQKGSGSGGKNISFNWKRNGQWSGFKFFPATAALKPTWQSIDLEAERLFAAAAFAEGEAAIHLLLVEEKGSGQNPPVAAFTFSPRSGSSPLQVQFDASSSTDPGGQIVSYRWSFGDGAFATGKTAEHTFTREGAHHVRLTVYDNENNYTRTSGTVEVVEILSPLNVTYEMIMNRGFLFREYLGKVTWEKNPGNESAGINVVKYNIYRKRKTESSYSFYDSVDAGGSAVYYDRLGKDSQDYQYTVTAVDDLGRESALADSTEIAGEY